MPLYYWGRFIFHSSLYSYVDVNALNSSHPLYLYSPIGDDKTPFSSPQNISVPNMPVAWVGVIILFSIRLSRVLHYCTVIV